MSDMVCCINYVKMRRGERIGREGTSSGASHFFDTRFWRESPYRLSQNDIDLASYIVGIPLEVYENW